MADDEVPRWDRLEFTQVAPVAVKACEVFTPDDDDDEVDRPGVAMALCRLEAFDERVLFVADFDADATG